MPTRTKLVLAHAGLVLAALIMVSCQPRSSVRFCFGDGLCVEPDGQKVLEDGRPVCELDNSCGDAGGSLGPDGGPGGGGDAGGDTAPPPSGCDCGVSADDLDGDCILNTNETGPTSWMDMNSNNCFDAGDTAGATDPTVADSDGDGIPDGCEDTNRNGLYDAGETVAFAGPINDSDCDGLTDDQEDVNGNGNREPNETDPGSADTDGDSICDACGCTALTCPNCTGCEDRDSDGSVDLCVDALMLDGSLGADGCCEDGESDPRSTDSDLDGLLDQVEDQNRDGLCDRLCEGGTLDGMSCFDITDCTGGGICRLVETCAFEADTDCDLLLDGREDTNANGSFNTQETDPLNPDTDGDLILDGIEDANGSGTLESNETDPRLADSDGDGISDGDEDANQDGVVQQFTDVNGDGCWDPSEPEGETDPRTSDTDGDGISDTVEDANRDGVCDSALVPDPADPSNVILTLLETCAFATDSDCDGLGDGEEDTNMNGSFELGETDPRRPDTDFDGLFDGCTIGADPLTCEDQNNNGIVDFGC